MSEIGLQNAGILRFQLVLSSRLIPTFALGMLVYKNHNLIKIEVVGRRSFFNIFKTNQYYSIHNSI
jgi:hypothetical protein